MTEVKGPLGVVLSAILFENKVLLLKHNKGMFTGYWGFPGGKIEHGETLKDAVLRETKEETGLDCDFIALRGMSSEIIKTPNNGSDKKHFLLFVCQLKPKQTQVTHSAEGQVEWFELNKLPDKIVPSDLMMLKEFLIANPRSLPMHDIYVRQEGQDYFMESFHG